LKIAVMVKNFTRSGGAERYAVEVTRRLKDRGHEIDLYSRFTDESAAGGMTLVPVPNRHAYRSVTSSLAYARDTARLLEGKHYDIVHSHERGYSQDVLTIHTFCYRSGFVNEQSLTKRILKYRLSPRSLMYLWLEKKQMTSPRLAAVSDVIRRDIQACYGRTEGVRVITPGVDFDWFSPESIAGLRPRHKPDAPPGGLTVLFVGSEFRRKGLDALIPAIGEKIKLIVVGRGEYLKHYRELVAEYGVENRVEFTGHITDDVRRYYAAANVVVLPSLREAFGMTVLEGMACGLPVVVSPVAGAAGLVRDGKNGLLAGSVDELKTALEYLRDDAVRRKMGEEARKTAESCSWDRITDDYEGLFTDLLSSRGTHRQ
jgi:UDP-glucose:(heptosyl)LPS alpha-1,3-glucosyltransferase